MKIIAVVGAANVDIGGFPSGKAAAGDSNPGRVRLSIGGVGRNIACNAARMGEKVELITALGGDRHAALIREDCARSGVKLSHALTFREGATSTYLYITDGEGDMALAVNDMAILERLTVDQLLPAMPLLEQSALVVIEANLPPAASEFLAMRLKVPVLADAVSAAKVLRLKPALRYLDAFKPNRLEAELLTGIPVTDASSAARAALTLLDMGVRQVFLTLGAHGVCCAENGRTLFLPGFRTRAQNATGAGDAFTAALAWAKLRGWPLEECATAGMAAASIAVESMDAVSLDMSEERLRNRIIEIKKQSGGKQA